MKKKESMTLKEFHEATGIPYSVIAARSGISYHQIYNVMRGATPTLQTAVAIEKFTKGEVSCEKLLPESKLQEIEEKRYKGKK